MPCHPLHICMCTHLNCSRPRAPQPSEADIGSSALESLLLDADEGHPVTLERLEGIFPFPLDAFQKKAVAALLEGKSVVVCAPTGAGKTAIAEAAAAATLSKGQRVIYTTPLKALSNQKLQETRARFGAARCGLQVGAVVMACAVLWGRWEWHVLCCLWPCMLLCCLDSCLRWALSALRPAGSVS